MTEIPKLPPRPPLPSKPPAPPVPATPKVEGNKIEEQVKIERPVIKEEVIPVIIEEKNEKHVSIDSGINSLFGDDRSKKEIKEEERRLLAEEKQKQKEEAVRLKQEKKLAEIEKREQKSNIAIVNQTEKPAESIQGNLEANKKLEAEEKRRKTILYNVYFGFGCLAFVLILLIIYMII